MEFKQAVVTQNGRTLMAKLLAGKSTQFTKIKVSSTIYSDAQLANLTALTNIKQETTAQAYGNNTATVSVVGSIENTGLQTGYYINTVGLYAMDPDKGEILYSVSSASVNGYMPPDTGVSKSGFEFKIYTEVGNATKVDLTVDPAAFATHEDIERISTLKTAYSWSSDGKDRFCTEYPGENYVLKSKDGYTATGNGGSNQYPASINSIPLNPDILGKDATIQYKLTISNYETGNFIDLKLGNATGVWSSFGGNTKISGNGTWLIPWRGTLPPLKENGLSKVDFNTNLKADILIEELRFNAGNLYQDWTPAPSEDYENAYPNYIGLAPGYSDKPEDYVWLPEPIKNQKKLDELIELKGQVSDIQDWIQAHS